MSDPVLITARVALLLYLARFPLAASGRLRLARIVWTYGAVILLVHVLVAFGLTHDWSHAAAVTDTARQTRELFGLDVGAGVWVNYACVLVWGVDAARDWISGPETLVRRDGWFWTVQVFLAFIVFNATVVFGSLWWLLPIGVAVWLTWRAPTR